MKFWPTVCSFTLLATTCLTSAQADVVSMTLDSAQSITSVSLLGGDFQSTTTSGTLTLDLTSLDDPFGVAQMTQVNAVLDDSLFFDFGFGTSLSTRANDAELFLITPGAGGTVSGGLFDQLGNIVGLSGTADIVDPSGALGGSGEFNLGTLDPDTVDFTNVSISKTGDEFTLMASYTVEQTYMEGTIEVPIVINGTIFATGFAAVPEPSTALASIGLLVGAALQRRRSLA